MVCYQTSSNFLYDAGGLVLNHSNAWNINDSNCSAKTFMPLGSDYSIDIISGLKATYCKLATTTHTMNGNNSKNNIGKMNALMDKGICEYEINDTNDKDVYVQRKSNKPMNDHIGNDIDIFQHKIVFNILH